LLIFADSLQTAGHRRYAYGFLFCLVSVSLLQMFPSTPCTLNIIQCFQFICKSRRFWAWQMSSATFTSWTVWLADNSKAWVWGKVSPQSTQSDGPVRFLILCSIRVFLLASLVAEQTPVHCSREYTPPCLSTGISNLLQPAQAEVVSGQLSTNLASWGIAVRRFLPVFFFFRPRNSGWLYFQKNWQYNILRYFTRLSSYV
jgi:hypothetical protein